MKSNKALRAVFLCALFAAAVCGQNTATTVSVDAKANEHPINPNIYGVSYGSAHDMTTLNAPLNRWGGNATSRYNWQIDAHSAASDYYFETYPDSNGTPSGSADNFVSATRSNPQAEPMFSIPMIDWLANLGPNRSTLKGYSIAKYGAQTGHDPYNPDAGNGISAATGKEITGNDPKDTGVPNSAAIEQGWVNHFVQKYGASTTRNGIKYYLLDNEPSLWNSTQRDVHPNPATYDEMLTKLKTYIKAIRAADPNAKIGGFEEWGWNAMYMSALDQKNGMSPANSDYNTHGKTYYYPWLLQQLYAYQKSSGIKMLDMLTVHCYNQTPSGSDDSPSAQMIRNRETRILWDPNFVDPSWLGGIGIQGGVLKWIPTLKQWVNQYYPGLEVGCTEYNWGDEQNLNGATTQADVLGIYGREGLDLATRWTVAVNSSTNPPTEYVTYLASQIYRNYDGAGSGFGDTSVMASVPNPDNLSAFAARRSSDGALTVMVINKQQGSTPVTLNVAEWASGSKAQVWQINSASQSSITQLASVSITNNQLSTTVPSQSITLFVIPGNGPVAFGSAGTANPSSVTQGKPTNIAFTLTSGMTLSNANVELQVFDGNGKSVATNAWSSQNLTAGASKPYSYTWNVPSTLPTGNYTVELGVFDSTWAHTYYWNSNLAGITVGTPAQTGPPVFASSGSATPSSLAAGQSTQFAITVKQTGGADVSDGNVELQVFDKNGTAVMTNVWSAQNFTAGESQNYSYTWTVPSTVPAGSYTAALGVFNGNWSTNYSWNANLAAITITSGGSGPPQFTTSGTAMPSSAAPGGTIAFSVSVKQTGGAALTNGNIELQVFDKNGTAVMTNVWSGQNLASGQTATYSYNWPVPTTIAAGSYTAALGVFNSGWSTNYSWNANLAQITIAASTPGDVTGDGVVDCKDVASVRSAFGTKVGQAGYNAAADLNHDGVVNVIDLAMVSRHLATGTHCQ